MRKILLFLAAASVYGQSLVSITGTITLPDGSLGNGTIAVQNQAFTTAGGTVVSPATLLVEVVNGNVQLPGGGTVQLYANIGSQPPGVSYSALYSISGTQQYIMNWYFPQVSSVNLAQIAFPPQGLVGQTAIVSPAQIEQAGATLNQVLCWNG